MSLRAVDGRFLLPTTPRSASVFARSTGTSRLEPWEQGLAVAGVSLHGQSSDSAPDLAIATDPVELPKAIASGAGAVIGFGSSAHEDLRAAGMQVVRYAAVPSLEAPQFLIPLGQRLTLRYFLGQARIPPTRLQYERNRAAGRLLPAGLLSRASGWQEMAVASRSTVVPEVCHVAAARLGRPLAGWYASLGPDNSESRVVFSLFGPGAPTPFAVVKVRRLPGMAGQASGTEPDPAMVESVRPKHLDTFVVGPGIAADVEEAAVGSTMTDFLRGPFSPRKKMDRLRDVAAWIVSLSEHTRSEPRVGPPKELSRARRFGLVPGPNWLTSGDGIPRTYVHGDLWTRNIVLGQGGPFWIVDWDDADPAGLPLRDLFWFLADALAELDGASSQSERDEHFLATFGGQGHLSHYAFDWIQRAATAVGLPRAAVGPVIWLGLADLAQRRLDGLDGAPPAVLESFSPDAVEPAVHRARLWLNDPRLGPTWTAWETRVG